MSTSIVVVDDDPDYRLVVRLALDDDAGLEVVGEAADVAGALEVVRRTAPDLVMLDTTMPGGDPVAAIGRLREAAPGAGIILMSGFSGTQLAPFTDRGGVMGVLSKDTAATHLASEISQLGGLVEALARVVRQARQRLAAEPKSVGMARRFAGAEFTDVIDSDLLDVITLLTSELVTNAVVHAGTDIEVSLQLTPSRARVEITDRGAGEPVIRRATDEETGGRGLKLVDDLSRRWGIRHLPHGGKTVWFEVTRAPSASSAAHQ